MKCFVLILSIISKSLADCSVSRCYEQAICAFM